MLKVKSSLYRKLNSKVGSCLFFFAFSIVSLSSHAQTENLKLHYTFNKQADENTVLDETGNGYKAILKNGAGITQIGNIGVLDLGNTNGYADLGSQAGELIGSLQDFTITSLIYVDHATDLSGNGNFIWNFGNSDNLASEANGCLFLSAKSTRYAISKTHWQNEQSVDYGKPIPKGEWEQIAYTQNGTRGTLFINGEKVKSGNITITPAELGSTTHNYIGKSSYNGDAYLKDTKLADFRIYDKALSEQELQKLTQQANGLNASIFKQQLSEGAQFLLTAVNDTVTFNIVLLSTISNDIAVKWESSDGGIISQTGKVTRPELGKKPATVALTASLSKGEQTLKQKITVLVLPNYNDKTAIQYDANKISLASNLENLRSNINLPLWGQEGSAISWTSGNTDYLSNDGHLIKLAQKGIGKVPLTLKASLSKGKETLQREFKVEIAEDEGYSAYLFAYFTGNGNGEEAIRFALSNDGFTYRALNGDQAVIDSKVISTTGGVRDPHILRGTNDGMFYMVVTDLHVSTDGWTNTAMILLKSKNLVDWTSSKVDIPTVFPEFKDVRRVWAPQTIYDTARGKDMLYFSMLQPGGSDIIYYAYANDDFTGLSTSPKQLFYSPENKSCIDGDIIYKDGTYNLFFKTEGNGNGIKKATSQKLTEGYVQHDKYLDQADVAVEGSSIFKLINSDTYILMYDMYTSGRYQFTESTDLENFTIIDNEISMNFHPRHGTVIPITAEEAKRVVEKWGTPSDLDFITSEAPEVKKNNIVIDTEKATIYLPVMPQTDLTAFDPQIQSIAGSTISPKGKVDFSKGAVQYTVAISGKASKTYEVTTSIDHNPVLVGYYADPEIIYSEKDKKFYLYPTSDGFDGWGGYYFKTFSSPDLVNWTDEGIILNLHTDVPWGPRNAWAPTMIERKIDGKYKYFYYFTAAQKVGVAVSDSPAGPFVDSGKPLVATRPEGTRGGQEIDPDIFHDPLSGKYFLYWGNGHLACVELNDDMISIKANTLNLLTPPRTFREGTEVFYRKGKYYILWSDNDTRDVDYRVRYGMSSTPTKIDVIPEENIVIQKDTLAEIYATGHNSVIQIPGRDEWYIVYHRFTRPKGLSMGGSAGFHREVCIDKLEFNEDGTIKPVNPTLKGIEPVRLPIE